MTIVLAVQTWRHYLLGHKFLVLTNQHALQHLLEQREIQSEYQKWLTKLFGYDFKIKYNPRLLNKATNAHSRMPHEAELAGLSVPTIIDVEIV